MGDDAHAVFGLLSDETRVDVLRAVAEAEADRDAGQRGRVSLSFSAIYDRVDVDNTSKLSYHLGELAGTFLRKDEDGYALTYAGERLARFVLSGNYEQPSSFGPEAVDGTCPFCGATALEASLDEQFFRVDCEACDRPVMGQPVTPAQVRTFDGDGLIRSVRAASARIADEIRADTCPRCRGRVATEVLDMRDGPLPDADPFLARSECAACLSAFNHPLTYAVATHPASVAFHWDRGVDVSERGLWEFHEFVYEGRWTSERVETDPDAYEVVLRHGDDALRARLDDEASVTETTRVRRAGGSDGES